MWARLGAYRSRIVGQLRAAIREHHTPHEVGGSFAIGLFVTAMPTAGLGLVLFYVLSSVSDRISRIAIFAPALVLNPVVKPTVYVASFTLGNWLFGGGAIDPDGTLSGNAAGIVLRLFVGNFLIGLAFAVIGYLVVYYLTSTYQRRGRELTAELATEIAEEAAAPTPDGKPERPGAMTDPESELEHREDGADSEAKPDHKSDREH